jgi:hypothetical protein
MPRASTQADGQALRRLVGFVGPLIFLAVLGSLAFVGRGAPAAMAEPDPRTEPWIHPGSGRVARVPSWADPRWAERLQATLAEARPFALSDRTGLDEIAAALRRLPFVREVERCQADPVQGLITVLALRRPVACLRASAGFLLVDDEGVVLEGEWPTAPRLGPRTLPVLGPLDDPVLAGARPGDRLAQPEHLAALEVVRSLRAHVAASERARLGRVLVDAREAGQASVACPGIRLELEGGRVALFGRAPGCPEPGELAVASKWDSLVRALELFEADPVANDWRLVDLRWDRPELALNSPPPDESLPASRGARVVVAREPESRPPRGGPRVR